MHSGNPTHRRTTKLTTKDQESSSGEQKAQQKTNKKKKASSISLVAAGHLISNWWRTMKDNKKNSIYVMRLRRSLEHSKLARWTCIVLFPFVLIFSLIWTRSYLEQQQYNITYDLAILAERCALKEAFFKGDFMVGSHRSLGDSEFPKQPPNCLEGLMQLSVHGVYYLDLDLIWDDNKEGELVVAHPMEFLDTTDVYSPCAKTSLTELIRLLNIAMPKWFLSLEPKADWDRTKEYPLLKEPVVLLRETLKVLESTNLQPEQCCVYVDSQKLQEEGSEGDSEEEQLLEKITKHCNLCYAMKRYAGYDAEIAVDINNFNKFRYEYIMPTIEFHPTHPNYNNAIGGIEAVNVVEETVPQTVYWLVDTPADLERVASFPTNSNSILIRPASGIVSNRPLHILQILKDDRYGWCPQVQQQQQQQQQQAAAASSSSSSKRLGKKS